VGIERYGSNDSSPALLGAGLFVVFCWLREGDPTEAHIQFPSEFE
jgi:hypothetical protein